MRDPSQIINVLLDWALRQRGLTGLDISTLDRVNLSVDSNWVCEDVGRIIFRESRCLRGVDLQSKDTCLYQTGGALMAPGVEVRRGRKASFVRLRFPRFRAAMDFAYNVAGSSPGRSSAHGAACHARQGWCDEERSIGRLTSPSRTH